MKGTTLDLATAAPADLDTRVVEVEYTIHTITAQRDRHYRRARSRYTTTTDSVAAEEEMRRCDQQIDLLVAELVEIDAEYDRRGGWTRVWVVPGGHAHTSRACHSLYVDTVTVLCPKDIGGAPLSGATEEEIVDAAGHRACTHCYPSAPVKPRPSRIRLESEAEADAARAEKERLKAEKAAAKAAKAITAPDGTPLKDNHGWTIETETRAQQEYCSTLSDLANTTAHVEAQYGGDWRAREEAYVARLLEALAAKHGETVEQARERLAPKVTAKIKRDAKLWK